MTIAITTAAATIDLCTLDDLPAGIRGTSYANDPTLSTLIHRASAIVNRYCSRHFASQTYTETVPGFGHPVLQLGRNLTTAALYPGGPLTTLTSVADTSTTPSTSITGATIHDVMALQIYHTTPWRWTSGSHGLLEPEELIDSERDIFQVVYTAGYTLPVPGTYGTLPEDIRYACADIVARLWYRSQRDVTIQRINIPGDVDISYRDAIGGGQSVQSDVLVRTGLVGPEIAGILDMYRMWGMA